MTARYYFSSEEIAKGVNRLALEHGGEFVADFVEVKGEDEKTTVKGLEGFLASEATFRFYGTLTLRTEDAKEIKDRAIVYAVESKDGGWDYFFMFEGDSGDMSRYGGVLAVADDACGLKLKLEALKAGN